MKKGIAVDTVILIILGVVVIGLIGYLLYMKFGQVGTSATLNDCRTTVITQYCPQAIAGHFFSNTWTDSSDSFASQSQFSNCASFSAQLGMTGTGMSLCQSTAQTCGVNPSACSLP